MIGRARTRLIVAALTSAAAVAALVVLVATQGGHSSAPATPRWSSPLAVDPPSRGGDVLVAASCSSETFCLAFDSTGNAIVSSNPAASRSPVRWRTVSPDPGTPILSVACPSASLCAATDGAGDVVESDRPATPGRWTVRRVDPAGGMPAISCPSAQLCVAGDAAGDVLTSSAPGDPSSRWASFHVDGRALISGVSCTGRRPMCVAVDSQGDALVSTRPTGGLAAWRKERIAPGQSLLGVSCPTVNLCVAVSAGGQVLTSVGPATLAPWRVVTVDPDGAVVRIDCPTATLCAATDSTGGILTSDAPAGGAGAWRRVQVDAVQTPANGLSCPSPRLCVAVDGGGSVLSTARPLGGASAWRIALDVDTGSHPNRVLAAACPSASACFAVDDGGDVLWSAAPSRAAAWRRVSVDGNVELPSLACPSVGLCIAADAYGMIIDIRPFVGGRVRWHATRVAGAGGPTNAQSAVGIACSRAAECAVLDANGLVATSSASLSGPWVGRRLSRVSRPTGVSCTARLCMVVDAAGDVFTSERPGLGDAEWQGDRLDPYPLTAVSCAGEPSLTCAAVDAGGDVLWTADPSRRGAWHAARVDTRGALTGVSCVSRSVCVAVDTRGEVLTSLDVGVGAGSWHTQTVDPGVGLRGVTCDAGKPVDCIAVDQLGRVLIQGPGSSPV